MFDAWRAAHEPALVDIKVNDLPRNLIHTLSEDLLSRFSDLPVLDRYDLYQRLMDYWTEVMQDDVYLIAADGWAEATRPRGIIEDKERKIKETPDLVKGRGKGARKYKMDVLPPARIVARYFADAQTAIDTLKAKEEAAVRELEELVAEHNGEEGALAAALNEKGAVTRDGVKEALKTLEGAAESEDESDVLTRCLALIVQVAAAEKAVKGAQDAMDQRVFARYGKLTEAEVKTLVVEDKWLATLRAAVDEEVHELMLRLAARVAELEERYNRPLPALAHAAEVFGALVEGHLEKMGLVLR